MSTDDHVRPVSVPEQLRKRTGRTAFRRYEVENFIATVAVRSFKRGMTHVGTMFKGSPEYDEKKLIGDMLDQTISGL